jgi:prevent-host-death family protein
MSTTMNMHEAKTNLSKLVERARAGEEIFIAKAGKPVVKLVPVITPAGANLIGSAKGKVWMADDFDATPAEFDQYL